MNGEQDFYKLLGVSRNASVKEIRQAYKRLARKHHPDVNPGDKAVEEKFKRISEAFEVLSDPEKRQKYDQLGHFYRQAQQSGQWRPTGATFEDFLGDFSRAAGGFGGSFADIFGDLFGQVAAQGPYGAAQGRRRGYAQANVPQRGQEVGYEINIPWDEVVHGADKTLTITLNDRCPKCDGRGGTATTCAACGGTGLTQSARGFLSLSSTCPRCRGEGVEVKDQCAACGGSGETVRTQRLRVKIPPGVATGNRIRIAGKGIAGVAGGPPGDLLLTAKTEEHPFFHRDGADVNVDIPVTFAEVALGAEIDVPTPTGTARLKVPPGTKSGQKLRLRGQGLPRHGGKGNGDQYVTVHVRVPTNLTKRQRELIKQLAVECEENPRAKLPDRAGQAV